jgi:hypothetical protein
MASRPGVKRAATRSGIAAAAGPDHAALVSIDVAGKIIKA